MDCIDHYDPVCGPWSGRKRRERVFLTTEEK